MESSVNNKKQDQAAPPKSWLLESILVTVLCFLPFGIVAIVYASKVESLFYAGRVEEAGEASRNARKWTKVAFWVGIGCYLLIVAYVYALGYALPKMLLGVPA